MAHAPRSGKDVSCRGWNSHGGCARGLMCDRKHDTMSGKNLHWTVSAELIRRGGRKNRPTRIAPGNVDGVVDQLRESNQRVHGEQPLVGAKPWWQKKAGSLNRTPEMSQAEWKTTKRVLDWASVIPPLKEKAVGYQTTDAKGEEEQPDMALPEEQSMGGAPCSSIPPTWEAEECYPEPQRTTERSAAEVREYGNPATPGRPDDLGNCDLADMEDKLLGVIYATDDWIGPAWEESVPPRSVGVLGEKQQRVENGGRGGRRSPTTLGWNPFWEIR